VVLSEEHLRFGQARAIIVNAGCANAGTGQTGYENAQAMTDLVADRFDLDSETVLIASTGVIGVQLPMEKVKAGIKKLIPSGDGGASFARAIMTTDLVPKEIAVRSPEYGFNVGGCAKGSGMIHPDMATMLAFITTDVSIDGKMLRDALHKAVDKSFNVISVDGDTSTNDSVFLLANGASGIELKDGSDAYHAFVRALEYVCIYLAKAIARDGEGATRLIELTVSGASSVADARKVIRTVLSSPLVKTAVYGADPNWGRIVAAAGRSGARFELHRVNLTLAGIGVLAGGTPQPFDKKEASARLRQAEVFIELDLGLGQASATGWGCDMSEEYIRINADYTT
jgi:glutamate N-acetyltransferase/amino-acid N-acetyltransferase